MQVKLTFYLDFKKKIDKLREECAKIKEKYWICKQFGAVYVPPEHPDLEGLIKLEKAEKEEMITDQERR